MVILNCYGQNEYKLWKNGLRIQLLKLPRATLVLLVLDIDNLLMISAKLTEALVYRVVETNLYLI